MKNGRLQCKDIPDRPVLEFLGRLEREEIVASYDHPQGVQHWRPIWATWYDKARTHGPRLAQSVLNAMPDGVPEELALAKMRRLIQRGLADGCACGCSGEFTLTDKGRALLAEEP